jgi:predicted HTH domain antitoxin
MIYIDCESYGIEIVRARVIFCEDAKYQFIDNFNDELKERQEELKLDQEEEKLEVKDLKIPE